MTGCDARTLASELGPGTPAPRTTGVESKRADRECPPARTASRAPTASASRQTLDPPRPCWEGFAEGPRSTRTPAAESPRARTTRGVVTVAADDGLGDLRAAWRALSAGLGPVELLGLADAEEVWEQDQLAAVEAPHA
jgi:hypothetical protein